MEHTKSAFIIIIIAALTACADKAEESVDIRHVLPPVADCVFQNLQTAPGWVCGKSVFGLGIQAVGSAEKSAAGHNYMQDLARVTAIESLAKKFKAKAGKMVKQYLISASIGRAETIDAVVSSTVKAIASQTLEDAKLYKTLVDPEGRMYVLVGLDAITTKALVANAVKTSMRNDQALWQELKAQKSPDKMLAGITAMED